MRGICFFCESISTTNAKTNTRLLSLVWRQTGGEVWRRHALSIQFKVYDVLGKEITILTNEQKPPGNYEVYFNASNLSSCIYFYELKSGNFRAVNKMLLLRGVWICARHFPPNNQLVNGDGQAQVLGTFFKRILLSIKMIAVIFNICLVFYKLLLLDKINLFWKSLNYENIF